MSIAATSRAGIFHRPAARSATSLKITGLSGFRTKLTASGMIDEYLLVGTDPNDATSGFGDCHSMGELTAMHICKRPKIHPLPIGR